MLDKKDKKTRKPVNILFIAVGVIVALSATFALFKGGTFVYTLLTRNNPPAGDEQRLETLRSDPMYGVSYPNAVELRRVERGSRGFHNGTEDPPTITYYAGIKDGDDEIIQFFIDKATENGWEIFKGPGKLSSAARLSVIFHKEDVGSLFVYIYDPERLNSLFLGEKLPIDEHKTIIRFTLRAEHEERPQL